MEDGKKMNKLNILYEDNHIIVVVKPYNVLSQGDSTKDTSIMDDIKSYIKVKYNTKYKDNIITYQFSNNIGVFSYYYYH